MKYEFELIFGMTLAICFKLFQKKIKMDTMNLSLISTSSLFLPILLTNIYKYSKNKEDYKKENNLDLTNNPFKNIFQKNFYTWYCRHICLYVISLLSTKITC